MAEGHRKVGGLPLTATATAEVALPSRLQLCPHRPSLPHLPCLPLTFDGSQVSPEILLQPGALSLQMERRTR